MSDTKAIHFEAQLFSIGSWTILRLPKEASAQLASRSLVMVKGTLNGHPFRTPLEPDGNGSHWLSVDVDMRAAAGVAAGDAVTVVIEPVQEWPEPEVPADVRAALDLSPRTQAQWTDITPMARHEWIRWISSTKQPETRQRRIEVSCSKLMAGERRPCCFNRSMCCVPDVSKNGVLLSPGSAAN
jgi:hypothetical protein